MARAPDERIVQAKEMYLQGKKLVEIAEQLKVPEGTVRRWKCTHKWDGERSETKSERSDKKSERSEKKKCKKAEEVVAAVAQVLENSELTDKQRLFCVLYVRCFNATKAYQKAYGVDYKKAASIGYRMLENDGVKEEILRLKRERLNREMINEHDIFQRYLDIAFADITDYVTFGREEALVMGPFGPIQVKDKKTGKRIDLKKEVNVVKFRESAEVDGTIISEVKQGKDGASIRLADRMKALQWLSDHMDMATAEQRARIDKMRVMIDTYQAAGGDSDDGVEIINDAPKETDQDI